MPNRVLRDWTDSDRVNALTAEAERFFVRLIMKADDFGRYFADPKRLKAFLFPLNDDLRETDISRWLAECERAGLMRLYEVSGKRYLELWNFGQRLRNMRNMHPQPPDANDSQPAAANRGPIAPQDVDPLEPQRPRPAAATRGDSRPESESESESETNPKPNRNRIEGNGNEGASVVPVLETGLNTAYQRSAGSPWTYAEQTQLAEVSRRPEVLKELETLLAYRRRLPANEKRFFPNSIGSLLAKWTDVLDKAHISRPEPIRSTPPPPLTGTRLTEDQRSRMAALLGATKRTL
jgi:hypothetical protein